MSLRRIVFQFFEEESGVWVNDHVIVPHPSYKVGDGGVVHDMLASQTFPVVQVAGDIDAFVAAGAATVGDGEPVVAKPLTPEQEADLDSLVEGLTKGAEFARVLRAFECTPDTCRNPGACTCCSEAT